ncbi:MAG: DNA-processing protein DprA [Phycisphaerae bacterium]|nr:DNA-processing protein DprA [Phycisphaerae bacterium]
MSDPPTISQTARVYLRLHLADGVGPITLSKLIERIGSVEEVLSTSADALRRVDGVGPKIAEAIRHAARSDEPEREIDLAAKHGVRIVCPQDEEYPPLLKHIPDAPVCLYVKGRLQKQDGVSLAIVGSRRPTYHGQEHAGHYAGSLASLGMTIISGLAYGVDASAHQGALASGGRTVAVLGNGLSDIYPPRHRELAEAIAASGAVVSELPMATAPEAGNFPRRNRIIAGMSLGTLVVEGSERSGAMITARHANDYNREVFALPGQCDAPMSRGPNILIREGMGRLVMCTADILDDLGEVGRILSGEEPRKGVPDTPDQDAPLPALTDRERKAFDALSDEPLPIEMIVDASGLSAAEVAASLTTLQLKRRVRRLPGNVFVRIHRT